MDGDQYGILFLHLKSWFFTSIFQIVQFKYPHFHFLHLILNWIIPQPIIRFKKYYFYVSNLKYEFCTSDQGMRIFSRAFVHQILWYLPTIPCRLLWPEQVWDEIDVAVSSNVGQTIPHCLSNSLKEIKVQRKIKIWDDLFFNRSS